MRLLAILLNHGLHLILHVQLHLFEIGLFDLLLFREMNLVDQLVQLLIVLVMLLGQPSEVFIRLQETFLDVYSPQFHHTTSLFCS